MLSKRRLGKKKERTSVLKSVLAGAIPFGILLIVSWMDYLTAYNHSLVSGVLLLGIVITLWQWKTRQFRESLAPWIGFAFAAPIVGLLDSSAAIQWPMMALVMALTGYLAYRLQFHLTRRLTLIAGLSGLFVTGTHLTQLAHFRSQTLILGLIPVIIVGFVMMFLSHRIN
jgi:hypothetical protein